MSSIETENQLSYCGSTIVTKLFIIMQANYRHFEVKIYQKFENITGNLASILFSTITVLLTL